MCCSLCLIVSADNGFSRNVCLHLKRLVASIATFPFIALRTTILFINSLFSSHQRSHHYFLLFVLIFFSATGTWCCDIIKQRQEGCKVIIAGVQVTSIIETVHVTTQTHCVKIILALGLNKKKINKKTENKHLMNVMCNNDESQKHHNIDHYTFFLFLFFFQSARYFKIKKKKKNERERKREKALYCLNSALSVSIFPNWQT